MFLTQKKNYFVTFMENFYEILGCSPTASQEELKQAYQKLILVCHPDKLQQQVAMLMVF